VFLDGGRKKNVFENFQKVALNITVMDDISHQILQKFGNRGTTAVLMTDIFHYKFAWAKL
jgi:hypothetical protein